MAPSNHGQNKQVDARSKIVAFLKEFVEEGGDEGGDELNDEEKASASTEVAWFPI